MYHEAYTKLDLDETASIIDTVNKKVEGSLFDPLETTILAIEVPFYTDWRFLDISDHATNPPLQRFVFQKDDEYVFLDWTYKPIYQLNQDVPIKVDETNVLDYLRFFFSHVKSRHGRFTICESLESVSWKEEPPAEARKTFADIIKPMVIVEKGKDGTFKIEARMLLKDALFKTDVFVDPSGRVSMDNQEILVEDMPVLDHVFSQ